MLQISSEENIETEVVIFSYFVHRDHTSQALTWNLNKKGEVICKRNECLHFNMFGVCAHNIAVAEYIGNLPTALRASTNKSKQGKLIDMIRYGQPSGSGTMKGYKR